MIPAGHRSWDLRLSINRICSLQRKVVWKERREQDSCQSPTILGFSQSHCAKLTKSTECWRLLDDTSRRVFSDSYGFALCSRSLLHCHPKRTISKQWWTGKVWRASSYPIETVFCLPSLFSRNAHHTFLFPRKWHCPSMTQQAHPGHLCCPIIFPACCHCSKNSPASDRNSQFKNRSNLKQSASLCARNTDYHPLADTECRETVDQSGNPAMHQESIKAEV